MSDLLLDTNIRLWVFVPIVIITFFIGILRHYLTILMHSEKSLDLQQVQDNQALVRSRLLRENAGFIPRQSFLMRKLFFNDAETGYFKKQQGRSSAPPNPMTDPSMMMDMMKGNLTNVLPMIMIGGWINWTFSGFVTTKVPFPLTLRFKPMLQRGIELTSLDASWVSSASWYFLNVFGLRSVYALVLGAENSADQVRGMQDQMTGGMNAGGMGPQDMTKAFKSEWEALEMVEHKFALENVEEELLRTWQVPDNTFMPETLA